MNLLRFNISLKDEFPLSYVTLKRFYGKTICFIVYFFNMEHSHLLTIIKLQYFKPFKY